MGFGFNLSFVFILIPLTGIFLIAWILSKKLLFIKILGLIWFGVFGVIFLSYTIQWFNSKIELAQDDYYGEYVIDRGYFPGKQSDWQYEHFRFEITEDDSIFFYETNKEKILKTYRGKISTTMPYRSARLIINMEPPTHHILQENPTTYRKFWSFYLVFNSDKFHNVFFKKGKWKELN